MIPSTPKQHRPLYQAVNLRSPNVGRNCGDEETRTARQAEYDEAKRTSPYRFSIAPRQKLRLPDGRELQPGDELKPEWLAVDGRRPPWRQIASLIDSGVVVESDLWVEKPKAAEPKVQRAAE